MRKIAATEVSADIKGGLGDFLGKEANSAVWEVSKALATKFNKQVAELGKEAVAKAEKAKDSENAVADKIQKYLDSPMSPDEEARILRATLHAELASGSVSPQLLDKLDKIIGVNSGEDSAIESVDFSEAFPDLAEAVENLHDGTTFMIYPALAPLWYNLPAWYARAHGVKRQVRSIHRRGGKDVNDFAVTVQDAIDYGGVHYYLFPTRVWAEEVIFKEQFTVNGETREFWQWLVPKHLKPQKREKDCCIILPHNNARIQLGGTDDLSFVGKGGKSYTMSEFSLHKDSVTGFIAPILRQSDASFRANGTLRGKNNQLFKMLKANENNPEWFTQWLRPKDTKCYCWVSDEYNINPELMSRIGEVGPNKGRIFNVQDDIDSGLISMSLARQEYLNEAESQVAGSYYAHEMNVARGEKRIGEIVADSDRVYTFWDLGGASQQSDETVVVFAVRDGEKGWKIIDHYAKTGHKIEHYVQMLNNKGYKYAGHYAPHDAKKQFLFGDLIGKAKELGLEFKRVTKSNNVLADIEVCRRAWSKISVHEPTCGEFLQHMEDYHEKNGKPAHDSSSHHADAFRTMCMADELGLVVDYLSDKRVKFDLPDRVGQAEEYCETGHAITGSPHPLWG